MVEDRERDRHRNRGLTLLRARSVHHDAARLDRTFPLFDLARDELGEVIRPPAFLRNNGHPDAFQPLAYRSRVERFTRGLRETTHDRLGRAFREHKRTPGAAIEFVET